jgi:hypothetical protein
MRGTVDKMRLGLGFIAPGRTESVESSTLRVHVGRRVLLAAVVER